MRSTRFAGLVAIALAACGGDSGSGPSGPNQPTSGTVRGTVVDQTAAPVPSAAVALTATGQTTRNATTAQDGAYSFTSVPVGAYTVTVTPPAGYTLGTGSGTASVSVVAGQQANANAIILNKTQPGTPAPANASVSMVNTSFSPQNVEVRVGGTVTWTNNDQVQHNATPSSGGFTGTGNMNGGQVVSRTFNTAGTFNYSCTLHTGMFGSITVR